MIPVTIVTGFLGSGKTTLLGSLIKTRQSRRLALLINEFGEISIDGSLIRNGADGDDQITIHDFPYGLIAYGGDEQFIPTLLAIAGRKANVDHLLIETSGLALPTAVMELLQTPELASHFILDATLVVVDTPLLLSEQFDRDLKQGAQTAVASLFEQQLEYADVVVLNKIDALDEDHLLLAEQRVRERAPNVRFLELAYNAQLDIRLAVGLRLHQASYTTVGVTSRMNSRPHTIPGSDTPTLSNHEQLNGHAHSGFAGHSHGLATHKHFHEQDPGWLSFVLRSFEPQQAETLKTALTEIAKAEPLLRCKGFILTAAQTVLVQGVRSRVVITTQSDQQPPKKSELVFIGYHLNRNNVAALLSEATKTVWK